jgi:hypothetical protein
MARETTQGICSLCEGKFPKASMTRHLTKCLASHEAEPAGRKAKKGKLFHVVVEGKYDPGYWLHVEMPATARLGDLDGFLRDIWLECCGHLSAFKIQGQKKQRTRPRNLAEMMAIADWDHDPNELEMDTPVGEVFEKGLKLSHEYDFGSTTHLSLKVVGEREGLVARPDEVRLLARNEPPNILCGLCHKNPAQFIDVENSWEEDGWFCQQCGEENELDTEEMVLPVVNSPRTGVCGYTGE